MLFGFVVFFVFVGLFEILFVLVLVVVVYVKVVFWSLGCELYCVFGD